VGIEWSLHLNLWYDYSSFDRLIYGITDQHIISSTHLDYLYRLAHQGFGWLVNANPDTHKTHGSALCLGLGELVIRYQIMLKREPKSRESVLYLDTTSKQFCYNYTLIFCIDVRDLQPNVYLVAIRSSPQTMIHLVCYIGIWFEWLAGLFMAHGCESLCTSHVLDWTLWSHSYPRDYLRLHMQPGIHSLSQGLLTIQ
jgi:hypothetical protein